MDAAIVTVGDELLVGDTENTNATWLCGRLADRGVTVRRVTVVPDEVAGDRASSTNTTPSTTPCSSPAGSDRRTTT